ncbi:MAG TPA: hypothetical protein VFC19_14980 [Candidatus Limnocylindrales bacterium]|nr:hypothetical protein [Candidatus Limnocylindrales bacterium]
MTLAERQAEVVRCLVAGGPVPPGFDPERLAATRKALLRKRSGEVGRAWPELAASYGERWHDTFAAWAEGKPPLGSQLDGYDFALEHPPTGAAAVELMVFEVSRRKPPAFQYRHRVLVINIGGRVRVFGRVN